MISTQNRIPKVTDIWELYTCTPEGLPLWKSKGITITWDNLLEHIFVLSSDLANYFGIRHDHLYTQNICKLQKEGHLDYGLPKFREICQFGRVEKTYIVYGLTRHQTEHLIMDFLGTKARTKKHAILRRLQSIEADVLRCNYDNARQKAQMWDGVSLLKQFGLQCSVEGTIATKKDIVQFLKVPENTLNTFLRKYEVLKEKFLTVINSYSSNTFLRSKS